MKALKQKPSAELLKAAETVFLAQAHADTLRPIVTGYQRQILNEKEYLIAEEWEERSHGRIKRERITDPEKAYLLNEADFKEYLKKVDQHHIKRGYADLVKEGKCPLLVAESMERDARRELLEEAEYITGIDPAKIWKVEHYRKIEEIVLKLCAPHLKSGAEILEEVMK